MDRNRGYRHFRVVVISSSSWQAITPIIIFLKRKKLSTKEISQKEAVIVSFKIEI